MYQRPPHTLRGPAHCMECGVRLLHNQNSICAECDQVFAEQYEVEDKAKAAAWGEKYKCLKCKCPLPPSRARMCLMCEPEGYRPSEDVYDDNYPVYEELEVVETSPPVTPLAAARQRRCPSCKLVKIAEEFRKDKRSKDGLYYVCKVCTSQRNKRYENVRRQTLNKLRGIHAVS